MRMNASDKKQMHELCQALGLTMSTAYTLFTAAVIREKRIPFDITLDPFYSKENWEHMVRNKKTN